MLEKELIDRCLRGDRQGQKALYDRFAPLLFSVCRRYLRTREDAEEALGNALFKVMTNLQSFNGLGSFEGWVRKIAVNEALQMLRKQKILVFGLDEHPLADREDSFNIEADLNAREIMELLDQLPPGYRTVFNLYVIEGYKHQEIADELRISINTSKSQLILAKDKLKKILLSKGIING